VNSPDSDSIDRTQVGSAVFESLAAFRSRLTERIREVNTMTEKEVMGAADDVHAICGAASDQIARLRSLLGGASGGAGRDDLTSLIDEELKTVIAFADELNQEVTEQLRLTQAAEKSLSDITAAAAQVGTFANRAKMLALNARIEASRDVGTAKGFAVIADEMKELSRGVAETNASIQGLAHSMAALLPGIVRGANSMHERARIFSSNLQQAMRTIGEKSGERRKEIASAVEDSDNTLSRVVSSSQSALSHLQFQDTVAQGLNRLDGMLAETQLAVCTMTGLQSRKGEIAPPLQASVGGGEKSAGTAGEVMMF
jgi:hypothetical protein